MTEQTTLEALTELVRSEAYAQIAAAAAALAPDVVNDKRFFAHIRGVAEIMPRLSVAVEAAVAAESAAAAEAAAQAEAEAMAALTPAPPEDSGVEAGGAAADGAAGDGAAAADGGEQGSADGGAVGNAGTETA